MGAIVRWLFYHEALNLGSFQSNLAIFFFHPGYDINTILFQFGETGCFIIISERLSGDGEGWLHPVLTFFPLYFTLQCS